MVINRLSPIRTRIWIPPQEIVDELKDLFIRINLRRYFERRGITFDEEKLNSLILEKQLG